MFETSSKSFMTLLPEIVSPSTFLTSLDFASSVALSLARDLSLSKIVAYPVACPLFGFFCDFDPSSLTFLPPPQDTVTIKNIMDIVSINPFLIIGSLIC